VLKSKHFSKTETVAKTLVSRQNTVNQCHIKYITLLASTARRNVTNLCLCGR